MTLAPFPFIGSAYLRSVWFADFERWKGCTTEDELVARLRAWSERADLRERSAEIPFVTEFFQNTWGYWGAGQRPAGDGFTMLSQYPVQTAGQGGGTGAADLALGWFTDEAFARVPQVLCEFKDVRSALDAPQKRKGNTRSPVKQACDYLAAARRPFYGNEPVLPAWAIATDMNEFRLYWFDRMPHQYVRFVIRGEDLFQAEGLLGDAEETRFRRYLFWRLFHRDTLLSRGGPGELQRLIVQQRFRDKEIEEEFYGEYREFREQLYRLLVLWNPDWSGTKGQLVRLAQTILDRCIFILYCEDMGGALGFPPQLLRDFLATRSADVYIEDEGQEIWNGLRSLFRRMDEGGLFGTHSIFPYNGGLFRHDERLDQIKLPNHAFCVRGQGANAASAESRRNLLYLAAAYNFAARPDGSKSLGLYSLGRIFEQSITELEIREAEVDGRESIGKLGKRKRDGVYYTSEWVVQRIVDETLGLRLAEMRAEAGWTEGLSKAAEVAAIEAYQRRLATVTVVDPACGSGAFLITAVSRLLLEWRQVEQRLADLGAARRARIGEEQRLRDILASNIYGVDINGASVEIAQLALWLNTARRGAALSALDAHVRCGNSLVDSRFYERWTLPLTDDRREQINSFDWERAFPEVFERGGFDVVVGNPPYVKLQNFRRVYAEVAE